MGDYSTAQAVFYDIHPDDAPRILEWLHDWNLCEDYSGEPVDKVLPDIVYGDNDAGLGIMLDGIEALRRMAPRSTWRVTQDAKWEWDGEHATYTPEHGMWSGRCTQDGEPTFTRGEIMRAVPGDPVVDTLTGGPWLRAISRARPADASRHA